MDLDPDQFSEVDRRLVDPPIKVDTATWSKAGRLDYWVKERWGGSVGYAVQTAVNGGSRLLIFVRSRRVTVACRCHVSFVDRLQDGAAGQRRQADGARRGLQDRHV